MAQEIYHRSNWGNPNEQWGNVYLNADLTNELYKRASEYENSWVTDQLLNGVGTKPSIILTPTAYEDGKLNSVKPKGGENLLTYSEDFSQSNWQKFKISLNSNNTISPDGTQNASEITINSSPPSLLDTSLSLTVGDTYTLSCFVKKGTNRWVRLASVSSGSLGAWFDLENNVVGTVNSTFASIENYGNGWYRISNTITAISGTNQAFIGLSDADGGTSSTQVGNTVYVWGFQVERGSKTSTYISTNGTAYKNADFDFTRGSSATRVNEQGLVSDVQILSGELVQNGDFEQIGSELVTNGGFDTDSDWNKLNSTISGGKGNLDGDGQTSLLWQDILTNGKTYKATFTVSNYNGLGSAQITNNDVSSVYYIITGNGTFTTYFTHSDVSGNFLFYVINGAVLSIDNVSVKEVGQDWTFGTGWNMGDGKAVFDGFSNNTLQQDGIVVNNKKYRLTYTILDYVQGGVKWRFGTSSNLTPVRNANGTYIEEITATGSDFRAIIDGTTELSIDNVSVVEVTDDTDLPRINYTNFSYEDVLGDELASPLDFTSDWTSTGATSITENSFQTSGSGIGIYFSLEADKKYKIKVSNVSGDISIRYRTSNGGAGTVAGNFDEFIIINTFGSTTPNIYLRANSETTVTVGNVTIKEFTEDVLVPYSGEGSLLLEPQSTNTSTYSNDFTQGDIFNGSVDPSLSFSVLTQNQGTAPDGTNTAQKLTDNNDGGTGIISLNYFSTTLSSGEASTVSMFVKKDTVRYFRIAIENYDTDVIASFDLDTGLVNSGTGVMTNYGNGWYRCSVTITTTTDLVGAVSFAISDNPTVSGGNLRNGTKSTFLWGLQAEEQSYATSYIPTEGSIKTRLQDICNNAGSSDLINSTEGVLYAEISALANDGTNRQISINNNGTSNRVYLEYSSVNNRIRGVVENSGGNQAILSAIVNDVKNYTKVAIKYKQNDFSLFINGFKVDTELNGGVLVGLSELSFDRGDGLSVFYGNVKCVAVFKEALSDTELQKLTTI